MSPAEPVSLKERVYLAARDGLTITVYALLAEQARPEQDDLVNALTKCEIDDQIANPLIIASKNGHDKTVQTLISKFKPDLNAVGKVRFGRYVIEDASALWCASAAGHKEIVKLLVKAGANVNQPTKVNSTPLRAACFEGWLDIVKYLHENGANINLANQYNNSCLMIAAFKGHLEVVKYLLEKGANPNAAAHCGATALHFSSECGNADIVRALFNGGARSARTVNGMTPLLAAAERCQEDIVNYIITRPEVNRIEKIDALELLGASFANDKDKYDVQKAFAYLKLAMEERWADPEEVLMKPRVQVVEAYDNRKESETLEDLTSIENDPHSLHMEGLAIRERILGSGNPEVPHPVIFRGAVFADSAQFDPSLSLWKHALKLKQDTKTSVMLDLLRFAQVFSQMLHVGIEVEFQDILYVLRGASNAIKINLETQENPGPKDDLETVQQELDSNMRNFLYLLVIFGKMQKDLEEQKDFNRHFIVQTVYETVKLKPRTSNGSSFLHMCVNSETPVDGFHTDHAVRLPCSETTKLLLEAGADAGSMDDSRNTPLHLIVAYHRIVSDFMTIHSIISGLIEAGAHIDVVNQAGLTPLQSATTGVAEIILKSQAKMSLKCLAAQSVRRHNVTYQGQVPAVLETFIQLHGP